MAERKTPALPADFVLFGPAEDGENNACVNIKERDWYVYGEGYKLAADRLVGHMMKEQFEQDFYVYPIAFLYRHYVELRIKQILKRGGYLAEMVPDFRANHRLDLLWPEAKKVLKRIWPDREPELIDGADRIIAQLRATDPSSYAFRYPVDKEDNPSLPFITHINLRQLADGIAFVARLLDNAVLGIEEESYDKARSEGERREAELASRDDSNYDEGAPDEYDRDERDD